MRWSVSFYLSSKRNWKFKHLVQTKPMNENIISNIMKLSVAGISLKKSAKKRLRVIKCKTNNSQQAEESKHCNFGIYRQCHRPQRYKFRQRLRWSRRRRATMTLPCNIQTKEKANIILILAVSDITTTVAPLTHRWQRRKKTNCLLHFRVLNLKNLSMNPAMMGSQEQTMINSR